MAVLIGFHRDGSIRERPFCRSVETYPEFVARSLELLASHRIDTILFGELGFLANIREVEGGGKKEESWKSVSWGPNVTREFA